MQQPVRGDIDQKRTYINRCAGIATGKELISTAARNYQPEKNIYQPVHGDINRKRTCINRCAGIATGKEHISTDAREQMDNFNGGIKFKRITMENETYICACLAFIKSFFFLPCFLRGYFVLLLPFLCLYRSMFSR